MPGDPGGGAARRIQSGDGGAVLAQHPRVAVDDEPTLGVEERRHHPHGRVRRLQWGLEVGPPEAVRASDGPRGEGRGGVQLLAEGRDGGMGGRGEGGHVVGPGQSPPVDRLPEVGEDETGVVDAPVEQQPGRRLRLGGDDRGVLAVTRGLVPETAAVGPDDDPAVHDRGPTDEGRGALGQGAVTLVRVQVGDLRPEPLPDPQRVPPGGLAPVVDRVGDLGQVFGDEGTVGAVPVGREQDRPSGDLLRAAVRSFQDGGLDPPRRVKSHVDQSGGSEQVDGAGIADPTDEVVQQQGPVPAVEGVAPIDRVPGVVEVGDEVQVEPDRVDEPLHESGADLGQRSGEALVGLAVGLGHDVGEEELG